MANSYKLRVLAALPPDLRAAYDAGDIDDDDLAQFATAAGLDAPPDFSNVSSDVGTTESFDEPAPERSRFSLAGEVEELGALGKAVFKSGQAGAEATGAGLYGQLGYAMEDSDSPLAQRISKAAIDQAGTMLGSSERGRREVDEIVNTDIRAGLGRELAEAGTDLAGSPTSALSVFGGPIASLGIGDVYNQEYVKARRAGLSDAEAKRQAALQAAPEAIGLIPAGKALDRVTGGRASKFLGDELSGVAQKYASKVGLTAAGEAAEEGLTSVLQTEANRLLTGAGDSAEARAYAAAQLPKTTAEYWDTVWRSMKAGGLAGGGLGTFTARMEVAAEAGKLAGNLDKAFKETDRFRPDTEANRIQLDTIAEQRERLFNENEYDAQRKADEEEAAFQTMERERLANQVRAAGGRGGPAANPMAAAMANAQVAPVTPEQIAAERVARGDAPRAPAEALQEAPISAPVTPAVEPSSAPAGLEFSEDDLRSQFTKPVGQVSAPIPTPKGLASLSNGQSSGLKAADFVGQLKGKINKNDRNANVLAKLIGDQKLVIVDSADQIPGAPADAQGWYDGERTYLVADAIDKDNVVGQAMYVAAHEVKHGGDESGMLGAFMGDDANTRLVEKARKAKDSNAVVKAAWDQAERATADNPENFLREFPAYLINASQAVRGSKGVASGLLNDVVSAVRTAAKSAIGSSDVNFNDVKYLADKMLTQAALDRKDLASSDPAAAAQLAMINGKNSPLFEEYKNRGLTYKSVDGNEKFVTTDAGFVVRPDSEWPQETKGFFRLSDIADHDVLFAQYPKARDIKIKVDPNISANSGYWDQGRNKAAGTIAVSPDILGDDYDPNKFKQILIHELQHFVQDEEGHARGTNLDAFLSPEQKNVEEKHRTAKSALDNLASALGAKTLVDSLTAGSPNIAEHINVASEGYKSGALTLREFLTEAQYALAELPSTPRVKDMIDRTNRLMSSEASLHAEVNKNNKAASALYNQALGELEAYKTQGDVDNPNPDAFPEQGGFPIPAEQSIIIDTEGNVTGRANKAPVDLKPTGGLAMMPTNFNELSKMFEGKKSKFTLDNLLGQFSSFGVLNRELGNIKELADGEAAMIAYVAEGDYSRVGHGIRRMAKDLSKRTGTPYKKALAATNSKVTKALETIGNYENPNSRASALATYVQNNPELKFLQEAMNHINEQTDEIIAARMRDPKPLTEEELIKYNALVKNKYKYFTTSYAAFQGKEGRSRNQDLYDRYLLAKEQVAKGQGVSAKYAKAFETYSRGLKFVMDNDVMVFDPEHLASLPVERISYLYGLHVTDPENLRAQIREAKPKLNSEQRAKLWREMAEAQIVAAGQDLDMDYLTKEGEGLVNGMLGLNDITNPVVSYYRNFKEDTGILEFKTAVPEPIRELYGEITDVPTRLAITLAKQGELAARMRMLATIQEQGNGKWIADRQQKNQPGFEQFTEQLNGKEWGPLNGMYTTPAIAAAINENLDVYTSLSTALSQGHATVDKAVELAGNRVAKFARGAASVQKYMSIVLTPFATVANAVGSPLVMVQNGVFDVLGVTPNVHRARMAALRLISNQIVPGGAGKVGPAPSDADLELFLKYGLLDSAIGQELRSTPTKFLKKLITDSEGVTKLEEFANKWHTAERAASATKGAVTEAFALSDAWVKPAIFLNRVDYIRKLDAAEGTGKTEDQIYQEAADMTKDNSITFQRAAPIIKALERGGVTQFAPYFQGVFRSIAYSYAQGFKDLITATKAKTPEGQMIAALEGAKRIAGAGTATAGIAGITTALAGVYNDDDDDELIDGARKLLFPEGRFGNGVYLGKDKAGNHQFIRLSRFDPLGPANDLLRIATSDESPEAKQKAIFHAIKELWIKPRATADLLKLGATFFGEEPQKNKATKLERLFPETTLAFKQALTDMTKKDTAEAMVQFIDDFVPGALNAFDNDNRMPEDDTSTSARLVALALISLGGRLDSANAGLAASGAGKELVKVQKDARDDINETLRVKGEQEAFNRYLDLREDEASKLFRLKEVYDGIIQTGTSPRQALELLKDAGVTAEDAARIRQGRIETSHSNLLSDKSITQSGKFQDRNLSEAERKKAEKERAEVIKRLKVLNKKGAD